MKTSLLFFLMLGSLLFSKAQTDSSNTGTKWPVGMTVDQFNRQVRVITKPLLVNFTAGWRVVCK